MFNMDAASKGVLAGWNNSVYDNIKAERFNRDQLVGQQIRSAENEYTQRNATLMNTPEYLNASQAKKDRMKAELDDLYGRKLAEAQSFGLDGEQVNYDENNIPLSRSTALNQGVNLHQQQKQQAIANIKAQRAAASAKAQNAFQNSLMNPNSAAAQPVQQAPLPPINTQQNYANIVPRAIAQIPMQPSIPLGGQAQTPPAANGLQTILNPNSAVAQVPVYNPPAAYNPLLGGYKVP